MKLALEQRNESAASGRNGRDSPPLTLHEPYAARGPLTPPLSVCYVTEGLDWWGDQYMYVGRDVPGT